MILRNNLILYAAICAAAMIMVRHGLRVGAVDDIHMFARYSLGEAVDSHADQAFYNWDRWATFAISKTLQFMSVSIYIADKHSYPFYEFALALMNLLFVARVRGSLDLTSLVFALFLCMADSWLVLTNFEITTVSLMTCFAVSAGVLWMPSRGWAYHAAIAAAVVVICGSYQGFFYILVSMLLITTLADILRNERNLAEAVKSLTYIAGALVVGMICYLVLVKIIHVVFDIPRGSKMTLNASRMGQQFYNQRYWVLTHALWRDWLVTPSGNAINWRHVSYVFAAIAALTAGLLHDKPGRVLPLLLFPFIAIAVFAVQPLQLLSGYANVPYRAFGFIFYLFAGILMLNAVAAQAKPRVAKIIGSAGSGFMGLLVIVLYFHTGAAVHSFELSRARDSHIVAALAEFHARNDIPRDAPLAWATSDPSEKTAMTYGGGVAIPGLASPLFNRSAYQAFISLNSTLTGPRPFPTQDQWKQAEAACRKYGVDGILPKFEYAAPLVIVCY